MDASSRIGGKRAMEQSWVLFAISVALLSAAFPGTTATASSHEEATQADDLPHPAGVGAWTFAAGFEGWNKHPHPCKAAFFPGFGSFGEATWTGSEDRSIRLSTSGGLSNAHIYRNMTSLTEGTIIEVDHSDGNIDSQPGNSRIFLYTPVEGGDCEKAKIAKEGSSDGKMVGVVPEDMPEGTAIAVGVQAFPGSIHADVERVEVSPCRTVFSEPVCNAAPGAPDLYEECRVVFSDTICQQLA